MMKQFYLAVFTLVFIPFIVLAQEFSLKGTIVDEKNLPVSGVSVLIKNSKIGTQTNDAGFFNIKVKKGSILIVSFVGYQKIEHKVDTFLNNLKLTLRPNSDLEDIVISALAPQRKISNVGSITVVKPEELQVPATSMSNIIGGRVAGVINMQSSGEPGRNISEFWVRGIGTFGANSSALVLIDGLEGNLNSIDPADVQSFSVLKDASATAVYGVRGANGVVLVTTKRGQEGKLKLTARTNFTISSLNKMPDYLGSYDYARLANEALVVRGSAPRYSQRDMDIIQYNLDPDLFPNVNWQKETMKKWGLQQTNYLSGQGGGGVARYFVSLAISNEDAAYKMDPTSRYNSGVGYNTSAYRTNLDLQLTPTTKLYFGTDGRLTKRKQPGLANTTYIWNAQSQLTPLLVPATYSTGQLPAYGPTDAYSPYVMLNYTGNSVYQTYAGKITMSLSQDLKSILEGLTVRVQAAYDNESNFNEVRSVLPEMYQATGRDVNGTLQVIKKLNRTTAQYSYTQGQYRKYHLESTLNYEKTLGRNRFTGLIYYYMSDTKDTDDIGPGSGVNLSMSAIPRRYQGVSSRITYGFNDTYLIDANFGYTGSENFQPGKQYGFFPSIAVGWVPTQYKLIKEKMPWVDLLKFRASYGSVGSDRITNRRFPYLTIINENAPVAWANGISGITESSIGADNLIWEKALKTNLGMDAQFLNNKLSLTVDVFNDQRDGIFQQRASIPAYVGLIQLPFGNVGKMKSWGSDGNISFSHDITKGLGFTVRGNYTYSRNKIQNWEQAPPKYPYQSYNGYTNGAIRGYVANGLFRDEQDVASSATQSFGGVVMPGDIKYKDINGDGVIDTDDRVPLSDPTFPRMMYGFGSEIRYKKFTFGFLFKGTGHTPYYNVGYNIEGTNNGMGYVPFYGGDLGNVLNPISNQSSRWTPASYSGDSSTENPNAQFPRLSYGYNANNSQLSTFWKGDGWYLRLQEVTLNYKFGASFLKKVGVSSMDLQFVGSNLHVWDSVSLWDPEQANQNGRAYPIPSRYTLQLYVNF